MGRLSTRSSTASRKGAGKNLQSKTKSADDNSCGWVTGSRADSICDEVCVSSDDLFEHVSDEHVRRGPKGFFCKWSKCGNRNKVVYITLESLQKHLKTHVYKNEPEKFAEVEEELESSDENQLDSESDEEEDFSVAKSGAKKRKSNSADNTTAKIKKVAANPSGNSDVDKVPDTSGFFYRFTCEWNVDASLFGMDISTSKFVKCKRKFKKQPDAVDHLLNHHIGKLLTRDDPVLQCSWEGCDIGEFSDPEELKEHVESHGKSE